MNYVFFDIECANCLHGEGKICSFGFVKTDETFNVIKKKDILIDPDAPFLLGNAKTGNGIKLAYPLFRFRWSHTFPKYYEEIKALLTDKDTMAFGFAVNQDVSYISYTCKRYNLPQIIFDYYDIQLFEKELHHLHNPSGLDYLVEKYHQKTFTYHRSDDDAYMTMEVFKSLLKENSFTPKEVIAMYPDGLSNTNKLLKQLEEHKQLKIKKENMKKREVVLIDYLNNLKPSLESFDSFFWKKKVYFSKLALDSNIAYMEKYKEVIGKKSIILVQSPLDADILVLADIKKTPSYMVNCKKGVITLNVNEFNKKIRGSGEGKEKK